MVEYGINRSLEISRLDHSVEGFYWAIREFCLKEQYDKYFVPACDNLMFMAESASFHYQAKNKYSSNFLQKNEKSFLHQLDYQKIIRINIAPNDSKKYQMFGSSENIERFLFDIICDNDVEINYLKLFSAGSIHFNHSSEFSFSNKSPHCVKFYISMHSSVFDQLRFLILENNKKLLQINFSYASGFYREIDNASNKYRSIYKSDTIKILTNDKPHQFDAEFADIKPLRVGHVANIDFELSINNLHFFNKFD